MEGCYHGARPKSVCPERVRREPERRRRKFRPETLRHKNGRRRHAGAAGLLESGGLVRQSAHRRGAALARLISQVTGQKGGRPRRAGVPAGSVCRSFYWLGDAAVARQTPLYRLHRELGARMVDFGGWDMPVQYSSQIGEHHAVRRAAGVFDVSHMGILDLRGSAVRIFLQQLLANDVVKLKTPGKALYSCMLNEQAGVLDDLIVYFINDYWYRMVANAGTRAKDLAWIREHAGAFEVEVSERTDLAMLAVQGPEARTKAVQLMPPSEGTAALALETFVGRELGRWFVARTGYTGEDGFEIMMPAADAVPAWRGLNSLGVASCGLGARDTLRLEAGMNLYGNDMDEHTHPYESGLGWTVALAPGERGFIGRAALERIARDGSPRKLVGLVLEERGVLRAHQKVLASAAGEGEITSGTYSPTLERSIALARVPAATGGRVQVEVRGKLLGARVVKPPFVRAGQSLI